MHMAVLLWRYTHITQLRLFVVILQRSWNIIPIICAGVHDLGPVQYMHQVCSSEILISQCTENEINNRCSALNVRVVNHTRRLKACEHKFFYKLFQRHAVLQADRNCYRKTVKHAAHGSAFLGHINEYLTNSAIIVLAGTKEYYLSIDLC